MNEEVKDPGLIAMISSILGGNKRADIFAPAPPAAGPPIAPDQDVEADAPPDPDPAASLPETVSDESPAPAAGAAPAAKVATTHGGKQLLPAEAIADLVLGELRKLEDFPANGTSVTVYGYRQWNAMITFAPFSTSFQNATRFRQALPDIVFKLRRFVELDI